MFALNELVKINRTITIGDGQYWHNGLQDLPRAISDFSLHTIPCTYAFEVHKTGQALLKKTTQMEQN